MMWTKAILTAGILTFSFCSSVNAEDCHAKDCDGRMDRSATPSNGEAVFKMSASPTKHFEHWKKEFVNPTACRMALCNGSCGASGNGCTVSHKKCK
jgi:hypothetical protein